MSNLLLVGSGGFLGAAARYLIGQLLAQSGAAARLPLATLVVNVTGCFAIGAVVGLGERSGWLTASMRLFVLTGLLGGYTTFSAFGYETYVLGRDGALVRAGLNVMVQVILGLFAVYVGHRLGTAVAA